MQNIFWQKVCNSFSEKSVVILYVFNIRFQPEILGNHGEYIRLYCQVFNLVIHNAGCIHCDENVLRNYKHAQIVFDLTSLFKKQEKLSHKHYFQICITYV